MHLMGMPTQFQYAFHGQISNLAFTTSTHIYQNVVPKTQTYLPNSGKQSVDKYLPDSGMNNTEISHEYIREQTSA